MACCLPNDTSCKEKPSLFLGHMKIVSPHYWLTTPRNPASLKSIRSLWLRDHSPTPKAQKKRWQGIDPSISQEPTTTFQCFPYLSRAIIPVIVQNANIPMLFHQVSHNDSMKPKRNGSVHSEAFEMQRQVWRKDAERDKCAHKDYTIFGFFLTYFEAVTFQDTCK